MEERVWRWVGRASGIVTLGGIVSGLWHVYERFPLFSRVMVLVGLAGLLIVAVHPHKRVWEWAKGGGSGGGMTLGPTNLAALGGGQIKSENSVMIAVGDGGRTPAMYPTTRSFDHTPSTVAKLAALRGKLLALSAELMPLNSSAAGAERIQQYNERFASRVFAMYVEARDRGYWDDFLELRLIGPEPGAMVFVIAERLGALGYLIDPEAQGVDSVSDPQ